MDEKLFKSTKGKLHVSDLHETFKCLCLHSVCPNSTKWTFEVKSGKFLRFMVSKRRIDDNLKKLRAIKVMNSPTSHKEVEFLNG